MTTEHNSSLNAPPEGREHLSYLSFDQPQTPTPCCVETIKTHARYNPMMVCSTCKQVIKCFTDKTAYKNYITFCYSRRRNILALSCAGYDVVIYRDYNSYPSRRH